jgi:hypothetical protein
MAISLTNPVLRLDRVSLMPRTIRAQNLTLTGARQAAAFAGLVYAVRR